MPIKTDEYYLNRNLSDSDSGIRLIIGDEANHWTDCACVLPDCQLTAEMNQGNGNGFQVDLSYHLGLTSDTGQPMIEDPVTHTLRSCPYLVIRSISVMWGPWSNVSMQEGGCYLGVQVPNASGSWDLEFVSKNKQEFTQETAGKLATWYFGDEDPISPEGSPGQPLGLASMDLSRSLGHYVIRMVLMDTEETATAGGKFRLKVYAKPSVDTLSGLVQTNGVQSTSWMTPCIIDLIDHSQSSAETDWYSKLPKLTATQLKALFDFLHDDDIFIEEEDVTNPPIDTITATASISEDMEPMEDMEII